MRILVPVDGSSSSCAALSFLAGRTTLLGGSPSIELLNIQPPLPARACHLVGQPALEKYYEDEAEKVFEQIRPCTEGITCRVKEQLIVGEPAQSICDEAKRFVADLVVIGSRGLSALKGLFFGSVSNGVIARSDVPILIVRERKKGGTITGGLTPVSGNGDGMRVGIAVDGSKFSRAAVRYILRHISLFGTGAHYYLINVVSDYAGAVMPDMAGMALPSLSEQEILALQKEEFEEAVQALRPLFAKQAIRPREICLVGNPGDEISAFAKKKKLDMIVMGSHGYGRFKSAIMGSVATRIAATCDIPLLVIRMNV